MVGPQACRNALSPASKDELVEKTPIDGSRTPIVSYALTPTPLLVLIFISAPALGLPSRYIDDDLQKITKLALELFVKGQEHGQL